MFIFQGTNVLSDARLIVAFGSFQSRSFSESGISSSPSADDAGLGSRTLTRCSQLRREGSNRAEPMGVHSCKLSRSGPVCWVVAKSLFKFLQTKSGGLLGSQSGLKVGLTFFRSYQTWVFLLKLRATEALVKSSERLNDTDRRRGSLHAALRELVKEQRYTVILGRRLTSRTPLTPTGLQIWKAQWQ
jgi:hypothetical protein